MKVKFLVSLCGGEKDRHAGDVEDFSDEDAIDLIDGVIAVAINKKDYEAAKERIFLKEQKQAEKELKLQAILYEDNLREEKERLLARVAEIDEILGLKEPLKSSDDSISLNTLKSKADELKIKYDEDVTVEALTKLIKDTDSKE